MPEIPPLPGRPDLAGNSLRDRVADVFAPDGALARALPDFEPRDGQAAMAQEVATVLEQGGVLLAEAGTGTGKTLAYLVPAILSGQRALVSTGTKNLQEQIFFKDIPLLREALDVPFTAAYMKGRANYLCLHRLDLLADGLQPSRMSNLALLPIVREWASRTETGDRAELEDLPEDMAFWHDVSADAETCLGTECPRYDECFVTLMRQRAAAADVVIVNHHLLCADAAVRQDAYGEVIPSCSHAIIDEAHQLEDVATQYFGYSISNHRLERLAQDLEGTVATLPRDSDRDRVVAATEILRDASRTFFADLALAHGAGAGRSPRGEERVRATPDTLAPVADAAAGLTAALDHVETALAPLAAATRRPDEDDGSGPSGDEDAGALARRAGALREELRFLRRAADPDYVYIVEFRGRGLALRASPIDVSSIVHDVLLDRMRATVITSATLTVDESFEYVRTRLGIRRAAEVRVPSEFDFGRQAILYLPPRMPDPRDDNFAVAAAREVTEILRRTQGRAFVLFTSYATLRAVHALVEMAIDYPVLVQGSAPRSQLLGRFRTTPHSVLFATSSFWQGVDVVGEALSCVIVDKLPFASPADPLLAARIDAIRARGGEPFGEYQVPLAILALQQGLGRLIRHRQDRGVLAVLDPRLRTKGYGRRFIASLPPAPIVADLGAVEAFFSIV